jgi:hypothetical protein
MQSIIVLLHWKKAQNLGGNPFGMSPKPEMLLDDGLVVRRRYAKPGRRTFETKESIWYDVHYDRDYVTAWLESQVLQRLHGIPYNQLQKLLSGAIALHKERLKEFDLE